MTSDHPSRGCALDRVRIAKFLAIWCLGVCGAGVAQAQHDCVPYDPTAAGTTVNSSWLTPTETDSYQIVIPVDPGGGYVIASITSEVPVEPEMIIYPPQGIAAPITQTGTNTNGPSPHTLTVAFEVVGGQTYDVVVSEDAQAPPQNHPIAYQWSWTFVSKPDCYEPNDGSSGNWAQVAATAREIPLDQLLEAYGIAGHLTYSIPSDAPQTFDWYKFTLSQPTQIWFGTVEVPSDQRIAVRLFNDSGSVIIQDPPPPVGGTTVVGPAQLGAGTYYLEFHLSPLGEREVTLSEGEQIPDHFETPYRFAVATKAITPCGFLAIFCDGFESSDTSFWSVTTQ